MNTILDYETVSILTDFENHISNHFISFLNRYVNVAHKKYETEKKIKDNKKLSDKETKFKTLPPTDKTWLPDKIVPA